jgi:type I restriction enzyme R subunit
MEQKNYKKPETDLQNWANILFDNNRDIDRLNNEPLTEGEMQQIVEQITTLRTHLNLNGFINGKTVAIKRDNPLDTYILVKEVSLKNIRPSRNSGRTKQVSNRTTTAI